MHTFVTGGTGYVGRPLIARLIERGHTVRALARAGSEQKLPAGSHLVAGNALEAGTWAGQVAPADTFVHLVGTPRPNPSRSPEAYAVLERLPSTAESAARLGLVTRTQMVAALVSAVEAPPQGVRVVEVPEIRNA